MMQEGINKFVFPFCMTILLWHFYCTKDCSSDLIADFFVNQCDSNSSSSVSLSGVTERVISTVLI